jgi:phosphoenolpyruvate-protein kinase (PTS system EI component)
MIDILDPTKTAPASHEQMIYAPRPKNLDGLRIGLVENTKRNSEAVLRKVAETLAAVHGMRTEVLLHKAQRAPLKDTQVAELKGRTDFAIIGVGD